MPYKMKKTDGYSISGPSGVHAKNTTKGKAMRQMNLLRGIEHGWKPTGKKENPGKEMMSSPMEKWMSSPMKPNVLFPSTAQGEGKRQRDEFHKRKRKE